MLKELWTILRSEEPLKELGESFSGMLAECVELVRRSGDVFFRHTITPEEHAEIRKQDVRVNKLERRIRKLVLTHLSLNPAGPSLPYCLFTISLVKDVERIGDYAKDLVDLIALNPAPLPDDELTAQLSEIRGLVETDFQAACTVIQSDDRTGAVNLIRDGRAVVERCAALIENISHSPHNAATTTGLVLAARYYMRIEGHILNLLSSVVMPLHKLGYYDEDDIAKAAKIAPEDLPQQQES